MEKVNEVELETLMDQVSTELMDRTETGMFVALLPNRSVLLNFNRSGAMLPTLGLFAEARFEILNGLSPDWLQELRVKENDEVKLKVNDDLTLFTTFELILGLSRLPWPWVVSMVVADPEEKGRARHVCGGDPGGCMLALARGTILYFDNCKIECEEDKEMEVPLTEQYSYLAGLLPLTLEDGSVHEVIGILEGMAGLVNRRAFPHERWQLPGFH